MRLLHRFLPHHFLPDTDADLTEASDVTWDRCISELLFRYQSGKRAAEEVMDNEFSVEKFLVQIVIAGPNAESPPEFQLELNLAEPKALVHTIEERSMELQ